MAGAGSRPEVSWRPQLGRRDVDPARIDDITFTPMRPDRRNELINLAYLDLGAALAARLPAATGPNWCTIAQWPSIAVGEATRSRLPVVGRSLRRAFGYGNRSVFYDVGHEYVRFLDALAGCADTADTTEPQWWRASDVMATWLEQPKPLRPVPGFSYVEMPKPYQPPDPDEPRARLERGLWCYAMCATTAPDAPDRAERWLYAGNVWIAAVEQEWLQEALAAGLRQPLQLLLRPLLNLRPQRDVRNRVISEGWRARVEEWAIHRFTARTLALRLGERRERVAVVPTRERDAGLDLSIATGDALLDEELALLAERWPPPTSGVRCWLSYEQRMRFVAALFAARHAPGLERSLAEDEIADIVGRSADLVPVTRTTPMAIAPPRHPVLDPARAVADEIADRAVADGPGPGAGWPPPRRRRQAFPAPTTSPGFDAPAAALIADIDERWAALFPSLVTEDDLARSQRLFRRHLGLINGALLFASLPEAYGAARGVHVLAAGSDLRHDPVRRIGRTADFVRAVCTGDLRRPTDLSRRLIATVRTLHARERVELDSLATPDDAPLNQEDMLGTILSFIVPVFETMARLGVRPSVADRDAYTRRWCAIGHLLGVDRRLLVRGDDEHLLSAAEATDLVRTIRARHRVRSLDGTFLLEALLEDVADQLPRAVATAPYAMLRAGGDRDVADVLLAPDAESPLVRGLVAGGAAALRSPFGRLLAPVVWPVADRVFRRVFEEVDDDPPSLNPLYGPARPHRGVLALGCLDER